jgi:transcriptional regulator with XRE-family HTH domain
VSSNVVECSRRGSPRAAATKVDAALGDAIRLRRVELGLSQEALADRADIHLTHVGDLERGVGNPNYATLVKVAAALRLEPGELVSRADKLRGRARRRR